VAGRDPLRGDGRGDPHPEHQLEQRGQGHRPAGYFNVKAGRLRNLLRLIVEDYDGDLERLLAEETGRLRELLLAVRGIGPETADSICLYAAGKPLFVIDAYTHRLLHRHGLVPEESSYGEMQQLFMDYLETDARVFNEYHALIVRVCKEYCRKSSPLCVACPLESLEGAWQKV